MIQEEIRTEKDFLGEVAIPLQALYGIHSVRARDNFPDETHFQKEWYCALGQVKKACYITARNFFNKANDKYDLSNTSLKLIPENIFKALIGAADEVEKGMHFDQFIVPAVSGGAGTSINLNINEVISNRALQLLDENPGDYGVIDPIEQANIFQSTNDVIPTSLKLCVIGMLGNLETSINGLRQEMEHLEKQHRYHLRKAYTQMQEAVPTSFGRLFSTFSEALSRDWWRVSKCFERIKVVNLGGSAIGSGITVPRFFIMEVVQELQRISGHPVTRGENLYDATNNLDPIVEVHGILKALAVNLEKISNDLRLLSSDLVHQGLGIPDKQVGSSIMPGKVNPVIIEFVISSVHKVYANDSLITSLSAQGCLELNAYLPVIGHALIESLKLLIASADTLHENVVKGIGIQSEIASEDLYGSPVIVTALVPYIGYNKAAEIASLIRNSKESIWEVNEKEKFMDPDRLVELLSPQNLLKEGFSLGELLDND